MNQSHPSLPELARENQCTACAIASIAMTSAISSRNWNSSTIDTILKIGSRPYVLARQTVKKIFLCPSEVPTKFQHEEYRFTGTVEAEIGGGLTSGSEPSVHSKLVEFFC
ncbi:hypothetical protein Pcinc_016967 [Petrolisthes cinctipes]|uniref:Uncharacterized protein n=1 Tax=Petrolisthes cinctipes TaxID=88211 RepID=A0AAE1FQ16_PETCI|nr:hypothetical protein Pcinc_016967 [Petrolisthes cinctipes]